MLQNGASGHNYIFYPVSRFQTSHICYKSRLDFYILNFWAFHLTFFKYQLLNTDLLSTENHFLKAVTIQDILKSKEYFKTYIHACVYVNEYTKKNICWWMRKFLLDFTNIHVYNNMTFMFFVPWAFMIHLNHIFIVFIHKQKHSILYQLRSFQIQVSQTHEKLLLLFTAKFFLESEEL